MKEIRYFLMLAMTMFFAACSQNDDIMDEQLPADGEKVMIRVGVDNNSRVSYQEDAPNFLWQQDDMIVVLGYNAANEFVSADEFYMDGTLPGGESSTATFTGTLHSAEKYKVMYKAENLTYENGNVNIHYGGQTQNGNDNTDHLKDYLLLGTPDFVTCETMTNGNLKLSMLNSLLRFDINYIDPSINGELKSFQWLGKSKINFTGIDNSRPVKAYACFDPAVVTVNSGEELQFIMEGAKFVSASLTVKNNKNYKPGHRYNLVFGKDMTNDVIGSWKPFDTYEVDAATHSISLILPGTLTHELITNALNGGTALKISGCINGADLKVLRTAAGCPSSINWDPEQSLISDLDITDAVIVASSDVYVVNDYDGTQFTITKDNILPDYAFCGSGLKSVKLPKSVNELGKSVFSAIYDESQLTEITIPNITKCDGNTFQDCQKLSKVDWGTSKPDAIADNMFYNCQSLKSIEIPSSVETIGVSAFYNTSITSLVIPQNVKTIMHTAFSQTKLESFTIPASVNCIGTAILNRSYSLRSLKIECDKKNLSIVLNNSNADFLGLYNDCKNIDFLVHISFAEDITYDEAQKPFFMGYECKSIDYLDSGEIRH